MIITLTIVVVAAGILSRTLVGTGSMRAVSRETALAMEGARTVIETMRGKPFGDLWQLYNEDPFDDPGGPGTAPGARFVVEGLETVPGDGGFVGRIEFPAMLTETLVAGGNQGGLTKGGQTGEGGSPLTEIHWQLREDVVDERLGLPRDLNGDHVIDNLDHGDDYLILPVRITVTWNGVHGIRSTSIHTMLAEMRNTP